MLRRGEGAFLGAMVWNYGLIVFGIFPPVLVLLIWGLDWQLREIALTCGAIGIVAPMLLYRASWYFWTGTYYMALLHELPANNPDIRLVDEDE